MPSQLATGQGAKVSSIEKSSGRSTARLLHGDAGNNTLTAETSRLVHRTRRQQVLLGGGKAASLRRSCRLSRSRLAVTVDLVAGKATHATGTDTLIGIESFRGSNKADRFVGDGADNDFEGMNDNDNLAGNGGGDQLSAVTATIVSTAAPAPTGWKEKKKKKKKRRPQQRRAGRRPRQ